MAESRPPNQLALDTNLLLDLADGADFAHTFKEVFEERGYVFLLPPTAASELHENFIYAPSLRKRELSGIALGNLRSWAVRTFELAPVQQAIAEQFARKLLKKSLLPPDEFNDGAILGETSLRRIPLLVTSDKHLLDIDEDALLLAFNEADLFPVRPVHPKRLLCALS